MRHPEAPHGSREPQELLALACPFELEEGGAQVVELVREPLHGRDAFGARGKVWLEGKRQIEVVLGVRGFRVVGFTRRLQLLGRELANRLEQAEPAAAPAADEALGHERLERPEVGAGHGLGTFGREAAREDAQPPEERSLLLVEQVVAPGDRRVEGLLAGGEVGGAALQQREAALEPLEQRLRLEDAHARGGELDRERQPVEPRADGGDRAVDPDLGAGLLRPLDEQLDGLVLAQRRDVVDALARQLQRGPARDEQPELRACAEQLREHRPRREHVLEVVEEHEHPA